MEGDEIIKTMSADGRQHLRTPESVVVVIEFQQDQMKLGNNRCGNIVRSGIHDRKDQK